MRSMLCVKTTSFLAMTILLAALRSAQASPEQKTLTGVVSDAMCGRTHMMKDKSDAECLRYCVKHGTKYALVTGKDVYTLVGQEADLDRYAAQKVTVTGRVDGATVTVHSVAPVKKGARP